MLEDLNKDTNSDKIESEKLDTKESVIQNENVAFQEKIGIRTQFGILSETEYLEKLEIINEQRQARQLFNSTSSSRKALVLSLIGLILSVIGIGFVFSLIGTIISIVQWKRHKNQTATWGIVIGITGMLISAVAVIISFLYTTNDIKNLLNFLY